MEIIEEKSSTADETEKEKADVENKESTDTDNNKEELSNHQPDVHKEIPPEESFEKGRKEGREIGFLVIFTAVVFSPLHYKETS